MEKNQEKSDLLSLLQELRAFQIGIEKQKICGKVVALVGDTKAGKTTLLYYLTGQQLKRVEDQNTMIGTMQPIQIYHNARISDTTSYPNIYSNEQQQWTVIDFPGLNDDRNLNKLLNIFILQQTFQKFSQVHFCFIIPKQLLEGIQLMKCIEQFNKLVNNDFIRQSNAFSIILTKTQDDDETVTQNFLSTLQEIKDQLPQIKPFVQILQSAAGSIFTFENAIPDAQLGRQILNKILQNKNVMKFHNFTDVFHKKYVEAVIGEHRNQRFQSYLSGLIQQMTTILKASLKLIQLLFRHVFRNLLAKIQSQRPHIQHGHKKQIFDISRYMLSNSQKSQDLLSYIQNIANNNKAEISPKSQNQVIQAILQLNKTLKAIGDEEEQSVPESIKNIFRKTGACFKLLNSNFQLQSSSQTQKQRKVFKQLSNYLIHQIAQPLQNILIKIQEISSESQEIKEKINDLKAKYEDFFKKTYQNIVDWKSFFEYIKQNKNQNQTPQKSRIGKSQLQPQPIQKSRKQEIQEERLKFSKFSMQNQLKQLIKNSNIQSQDSKTYNQQSQRKTAKIINALKQCIRKYVNKGSKDYKQYEKQFYDNLTKCQQVKDDEFLKFFFQNLIILLQIFDEFDKWSLFKSIIQKKVCLGLIQFNLFQEAALFAMAVSNMQILQKILQNNCKVHKLKRTFIQDKLISFFIQMKSKSLLIKCYNELSCNFVQDRFSTDNNYWLNRQKLSESLQKIKIFENQPKTERQKQNKQKININIKLEHLYSISPKDIISKLTLIKQRNQKIKQIVYALKKRLRQKSDKIK